MNLHVIILAAGKGSRMRSVTPKVLHKVGGKPLLEHVIQSANPLNPKKIHIVYSDDSLTLHKNLKKYSNINWAKQTKQLGTGHAVIQALPFIDKASQVLILYGDVPLVKTKTLKNLLNNIPENSINLLTAKFSDPTGFGRIVRNKTGIVTKIVEQKDASLNEQKISEINTGIMATESKVLHNYLPKLDQNNAQKEYYLTDIIEMLNKDNLPIQGIPTPNPDEVLGVNNKIQLAQLEKLYQKNISSELMDQGLTLLDPNRFDVRGNLTIGNDVTIDINVIVEGDVHIDSNSTIGPNSYLKNVRIGKNVTINANSVIEDAVISDECIVGPFARVRPGTKLDSKARIGNFVEVKNSTVGKNSKANHLTYIGDCTIGENANIGAGTITCNYDGTNKHQTIIEDSAFIGSNTSLVAPVKIEKGAIIGAGSTITSNAPTKKLTVARSKQITIENWPIKKRGG